MLIAAFSATDVGVMSITASLHTANLIASKNVCRLYNDTDLSMWHHANMESPDRNYLSAWRKFRKMSQEELADQAGTTKSVVSLLENEKRPLSSTWLRKFADILDTQPGHILDHDPANLDNDIVEIWGRIAKQDRKRAASVLRAFMRTGTDD